MPTNDALTAPHPTDDEQADYARSEARAMVRAGFRTLAQVEQAVSDLLEPDVSEATAQAALRAARAEWDKRLAEQETWTDEGDHARLAAAFADLGAEGVLARMDFTCCRSCGQAEIGAEIDPAGPVPDGYAFFHSQDSAYLADAPAVLYLAYGPFYEALGIDPGPDGPTAEQQALVDEATVRVGRTVADAVKRHGLDVTWDGDPAQRIRVTITEWRKRLPG